MGMGEGGRGKGDGGCEDGGGRWGQHHCRFTTWGGWGAGQGEIEKSVTCMSKATMTDSYKNYTDRKKYVSVVAVG